MKEIKIYEIPNIDFVERIDDPYIGMIFYVADIDTYYSVKTLKEINGINMKGSKVVEYVIDDYADFGTGSGGGSGLTATQLSNIAKIPAIKSTVDALPNNYASKNHNHSEYASSSHRHDASEIDNLPSGGGVSQEDINTAVNNYLTEHPVQSGATAQQAAQIEANKTAIGDENSGLTKKVNDLTVSLSNVDAVSLNGKSFSEPMTKAEYDAISAKDPNILYLVNDDQTISGIPDYSSSDANKVLAVNSNGTALAWTDVPNDSNFVTREEMNAAISSADVILTGKSGKKYKLIVNEENGTLNTIEVVSVNSVSLDKGNITLTVGNTEQLTPTISPSNATNKEVNWSCNNDNCTVVNGLVTAIKEGSSVITVTTVDGNKTANCNVTVNAKVAVLSDISAVYTQGNVVIYEGDSLDRLKNNLVVTANYDDGSNNVVTDYALSGNLTTGTSTITVTYQNKTTTFNVTVTANTSEEQQPILSFTKESGVNSNEWIDSVSGKTMTLNNTELKDDGVYFNGTNAWGKINDYALSEDNDFSIKTKFKWHSITNRYAKLFYFNADDTTKLALRIEKNFVSMYINNFESKVHYTENLNNDLEKDYIDYLVKQLDINKGTDNERNI